MKYSYGRVMKNQVEWSRTKVEECIEPSRVKYITGRLMYSQVEWSRAIVK